MCWTCDRGGARIRYDFSGRRGVRGHSLWSRTRHCGLDRQRAVFDFFFVPPYRTFAVSDTEYFITFGVMLGIGLLDQRAGGRQRAQLRASQEQEQRTAQLFRMTRQLSELSGTDFLLQTAGQQLKEFFGGEIVVYLREPDGSFSLRLGEKTSIAQHRSTQSSPTGWPTTTAWPAPIPIRCPMPPRCSCRWSARNEPLARWESGRRSSTLPRSRTTPLAGNLRQPDCPVDRARPIGAGSTASASANADRTTAQFAAQLGLARSAHAADGHRRHRGQFAEGPLPRPIAANRRCCKRLSTNRINWSDWLRICSTWRDWNRARWL